jgi:polar amino acid transport system substrate-binding protein
MTRVNPTVLLALGLLTVSLPALGAGLPEAIAKRGSINAGVVPNYPPLEFRDPASGDLSGFDIEIGQAIAARLGSKIAWQETSFEQMLPSLGTGRVDIILSGMTDLATRHETATFIDYMKTGPQFFVRAARIGEFAQMTSLCGKAVGASRRTSTPKDVAAWSDEHCVKAKLEPIRFVGTEGSADARTQLKQGRIDAAVQGSETLPYIMEQEPNAFAPVGGAFKTSYNGIAVRKDDTALQQAISDGLSQMIADGSYAKLLAKWKLGDQGIEKVLVNAGE